MNWFRKKINDAQKVEVDPRVYTDLKTLVKLGFKAQGFSLLPRQPVKGPLSGRHGSKLRGRGLNFEELRHYRLGDDIRTMDWKVTNRTGKPHVRVYTEERERTVYLLLDQRSSMFFGSQQYMKSVVAAEIAALLAWRVVQSGDKVGMFIFNDDEEKAIRPSRSQLHTTRMMSDIVDFNQSLSAGVISNASAINCSLKNLAPQLSHDALLIYVGDGFGWDNETSQLIRKIAQHNDVMAVSVIDEGERELPQLEQIVVSDGVLQAAIDGKSKKLQGAFKSEVESELGKMRRELNKYSIPLISIDTENSAVDQVVSAFQGGQ